MDKKKMNEMQRQNHYFCQNPSTAFIRRRFSVVR